MNTPRRARSFLLFLIAATFSCATDGSSNADKGMPDNTTAGTPLPSIYHENPDLPWIWDCLPRDGAPVFFATSGLRKNREEEKVWALRSAAVQSSQFEGISGSRDYLMQRDSLSFGRLESSEVFFNHEEARALYDNLEVLEESANHDGTYLLARNPGQKISIPWSITYRNGTPTWISEIPVIPGYLVVVGSVRMHRTFTDSLAAADRAAFLEMLSVLYGRIDTQRDERTQSTETRETSTHASTTRITATGEIRNFLVIARWRDEHHNYWSLAVCPDPR